MRDHIETIRPAALAAVARAGVGGRMAESLLVAMQDGETGQRAALVARTLFPRLAATAKMTGMPEDWLAENMAEIVGDPVEAAVNPQAVLQRGLDMVAETQAAQTQADDPPARGFTVGNPYGSNVVGMSHDSPAAVRAKIADATAAVVAKNMGLRYEPTIGRSVGTDRRDHARLVCQMAGVRPRNDHDALDFMLTGKTPWLMAGSHSSGDMPVIAGIAGAVAQNVIGRGLEEAPIALAQAAHVIPATDFRDRRLANTTGAGALSVVPEGGEVRHVTVDESGEVVPAPKRLAAAFSATAELMRNASAGGYDLETRLTAGLLSSAQEAQRSALAAAIIGNLNLADGQPVFHASRGNTTGTAAGVTVASVGAGRAALARLVDSQGVKRPVVPSIVLVPPEKQTEAEQLVAQLSATKVGDVNPFAGQLRVLSDPGLPGTGTYHWYLVPDPAATDGLALITLDDMPTPQVEVRDNWPNFGMTWRVQWPLTAAFVRPSWYRTAGN